MLASGGRVAPVEQGDDDHSEAKDKYPNAPSLGSKKGSKKKQSASPVVLAIGDHKPEVAAGEILSAQMILEFRVLWDKLRGASKLMCVYAISGVLVNILARELTFYCGNVTLHQEIGGLVTIEYNPRYVYWLVQALRITVTLTTLLTIHHLKSYYDADHAFLGLSRAYLGECPFWHTNTKREFWKEVALLVIHEPPFVDYVFNHKLHYDEENVYIVNVHGLLMFFRAYMLWRIISHTYYSGGTKVIGLWNRFEFSPAFVIRNILHDQPLVTIGSISAILVFATSYQLAFCERGAFHAHPNLNPQGHEWTLFDAVWCTLITMTTVGFGDLFPETIVGRLVLLEAAFLGVVFVAVTTAVVMDMLSLYPYEGRVVEFLLHARAHDRAKVLAARVIQRMWRYRKACRREGVAIAVVINAKGFEKEEEHRAVTMSALTSKRMFRTKVRQDATMKLVNKSIVSRLKYFVLGVLPPSVDAHKKAIEGVFDFCEFRKTFKSLDQRKSQAEMVQTHIRDVKEYIAFQHNFFDDKALEDTPFEDPKKAQDRERAELARKTELTNRRAISTLREETQHKQVLASLNLSRGVKIDEEKKSVEGEHGADKAGRKSKSLIAPAAMKTKLAAVFRGAAKAQHEKHAEIVGAALSALKAIKQVKMESKERRRRNENRTRIGGVYGRVLELNIDNKAKTDKELDMLRQQQAEMMAAVHLIQMQVLALLPEPERAQALQAIQKAASAHQVREASISPPVGTMGGMARLIGKRQSQSQDAGTGH